MSRPTPTLGASPFLVAGLLAGVVLAAVEVALIALWHPGRQPLGLPFADWIGAGCVVCVVYAAAGAFHGSWLAICFRASLARRGRSAPGDARRLTAASFLWVGGTALALWVVRQAWPGGFEALPVGRTALVVAFASLVGVLAILLAETIVRTGPRVALALLACVLAGSAWQLASRPAAVPPDAVGAPRTSVVLVVADALRADRIGAYARVATPGQPRTEWSGRFHAPTPHLDRLAREGTLFERFFVAAPFTWGSFAAFFTGRHAGEHGLLAMDPAARLAHRVPTVAEAFRERGYATAAFLSGTLTNGSGLVRGFDVLFEETAGRGPFRPEEPLSALLAELFPMRWLVRRAARADREIVVHEAARWLERGGERPFFLVVHLFGTHVPYDPPAAHRVPGTEDAPPFDAVAVRALESGAWRPDDAERARVRGLYDGCVSWVDDQVGRLLHALESAGRLDDTELWITADHGEELFDHRVGERWAVEHDWMWNTNLRVPLIVRGPRWQPGHRIANVRSAVDWSAELARRHGLAEFAGDGLAEDRPGGIALAENHLYRAAQDERYKLLVERSGERRAFLYDLWNDPDERAPLSVPDDAARAARERLAEALQRLRDRERAPSSPGEDVESRRALEAHGYLGGTRPRRQVERAP